MNLDNREPMAAESYATFWEPIMVDPPQPALGRDPKDAYQDFVNVTEDVHVTLHVEQI
ncbi:hypothetical protein VT84_10705 [Gemmata sp. SH-PL17]|uniref:Uncharacterized protein n=1 Tax=Gemmata massiliana TaxID=1210884 RepID=A0A6P2D5Z4_9BACT|nr:MULTISPECIES: hypothetical protein [Gemmata]AMV24858.1 hypothetical protein VT84_10705 [Gemmata sp. SH-PL17]VTR96569.1 unnamed protein product [Gemmata massiliana]